MVDGAATGPATGGESCDAAAGARGSGRRGDTVWEEGQLRLRRKKVMDPRNQQMGSRIRLVAHPSYRPTGVRPSPI